MILKAYFDGACDPNPGGTAAYGAVILHRHQRIWKCSELYYPPAGHEKATSNNIAEYCGLIAVLEWLTENEHYDAKIRIFGDSNLVINQIFGSWRIKRGLYVPLAHWAKALVRPFTDIEGRWISRSENTIADRLSKIPLKRMRVKHNHRDV
jgi:ribonuclease HI